MSILGIQNFAKDEDGKLFLTDEQTKKLSDKYGQSFVDAFTADLAKMQVEGDEVNLTLSAEEKLELDASRIELQNLKSRISALETEKKTFEATIAKLEKEPAADGGKKVPVNTIEAKLKEAGVNLSLKHNRFLCDYLQGKVSGAYSGNSTIDTQELKTEFGKYVDSNRLEILRGLFGKTESTECMSTIITDKTEVRANQASVINTVLQQFVPKWTPSGAAKFTPLRIKNFKCKLNVPIIPSDIMEDIIGYMYDEQASTLQSMPVVRYILNQLIFPSSISSSSRNSTKSASRLLPPVVSLSLLPTAAATTLHRSPARPWMAISPSSSTTTTLTMLLHKVRSSRASAGCRRVSPSTSLAPTRTCAPSSMLP